MLSILILVGFCIAQLFAAGIPHRRALRWGNGALPSLDQTSLEELQCGMDRGDFTAADLVEAYLARISEVNPTLFAVTEINPDASCIAQQLDQERQAGVVRSPLHGIPILLKNNIATLDKMNNTAGSYALLGSKVARESTVASNLRQAGAILLGKAGMSEWAGARGSNDPDGWSPYGGQVTGAFYPNQDPAGSSSGSGVAASIGLAFATIGTDTEGSIILPSGQNNVVGIRPTVGLVSRSVVVPFSLRQDSVGPLARTVWDAAHILNIIASQDPADNYTLANPNPGIDYTAGLNQTPQAILATARIGIPANVMATLMLPEFNTLNSVTPVASSYYAAAALMASNGAFINQNSTYSAWLQFLNQTDNTQNVAVADFRANLNDYLSALTGPAPRSLEQVRNFTQSYPPEGYPAHSTSTFDLALSQPPNTDASIWAQYQQNLYFANEGGVVGALDRDNLDAVILPSVVAPFVADLGGLPVVSVPLGFYPANQTIYNVLNLTKAAPGIPYGISFLGRKWSEKKLIELAFAFEQLTNVQEQGVPVVAPTTDLKDVLKKR